MRIEAERLKNVFAHYEKEFQLPGNETIRLILRPISAIDKIEVGALWMREPGMAQRRTWELCVVGWSGVEYSDGPEMGKAIPFTFDGLVRVCTIFPDLARQINDHLAERNEFFSEPQKEEKQGENFTGPPSV